MKTIQYAIHRESGFVVSRVGSELAWPILDYNNMLPENSYKMDYYLDKITVFSVAGQWNILKWTRKIPKHLKNTHRKFWGFPLLK